MKRIESKEYFDSVQAYFADDKEPARVYRFFLGSLREDDYKLSEDILFTVSIRLKRQKTACNSALAQYALLYCVQSRKNKIKMKFFNPFA